MQSARVEEEEEEFCESDDPDFREGVHRRRSSSFSHCSVCLERIF